jgi:cell division septum initiation protein DivIVA
MSNVARPEHARQILDDLYADVERLTKVNAELLEALKKIKKLADYENKKTECLLYSRFSQWATQAIVKAEAN